MPSAPAVGVVIPAHNAGRFIDATLQSIVEQTFTQWQCVVIDDGSDDDTLARATAFAGRDPRFRVEHQAKSGPCVARNRGFDLLHPGTRYVSFMDADDVWHPDALETLYHAAVNVPDVIGAHGLADFIDDRGARMDPGVFARFGRSRLGCRGGWPRPWPASRPTTFENIVVQSILFPPGLILAEAPAYRAVGLFDPNHVDADDWEVLLRLLRTGDLAFVDEVILDYRRHDANFGAGSTRASGVTNAFRATFDSPSNTPGQQRILRDAWRARQVIDTRARWQQVRHHHRLDAALRFPLLLARYLKGRPPAPGRHV
ncbi:MAG TPA: glycosyltransferase family A protein [Acidimicrobiia bacterium]